jgi:hypothetical protein
MIRDLHIIRHSAAHLAEAAKRTLRSLNTGDIQQEPHFTDRMLGRIEEAMEDYVVKGVRWTAKTLTDHGRKTQEIKYGADFLSSVEFDLPSYAVKKGFLAQSKLIEPDAYFAPSEYDRLKDQCDKMLRLSPESFVFLYHRDGITVVPAQSVASSRGRMNPHTLYGRDISRFFEEHFQCFLGDARLNSSRIDTLDKLHELADARAMLRLKATTA